MYWRVILGFWIISILEGVLMERYVDMIYDSSYRINNLIFGNNYEFILFSVFIYWRIVRWWG